MGNTNPFAVLLGSTLALAGGRTYELNDAHGTRCWLAPVNGAHPGLAIETAKLVAAFERGSARWVRPALHGPLIAALAAAPCPVCREVPDADGLCPCDV